MQQVCLWWTCHYQQSHYRMGYDFRLLTCRYMFKCIKIRVFLVSFSTYSYLLFLSKYFLFSFRQTGIQFHRRNIFTRTPSFPIVSGGFIFSTDGCLAVLIPRHKGRTTNLFQFFLSLTILVALVLRQSRLVTRNTILYIRDFIRR